MRISLVAAHDSKMEEEFSMFFSCFCYGPEFARGILGNSHPQTLRIRGIRGVDFIGVSVARVWCVRGRPNTENSRADDSMQDQKLDKNYGLETPRRSVFEEFVGWFLSRPLGLEFGAP